jgi:signal transduction histidine kinase
MRNVRRSSLATRFSVSIIAVAALSILSSSSSLFVAYSIGRSMERIVADNVESVVAAEEVEIALLEQRGFVTSYVLDHGDSKWLAELAEKEPAFQRWLAKAKALAYTQAEQDYLTELDGVFAKYDAARDLAVARFKEGEVEEARRLVLHEVRDLGDRAYNVCEKYLAFNREMVTRRTQQAHRQFRWLTAVVGASVLVTCLSGVGLFVYFLRRVLLPLRSLATSARQAVPAGQPGEEDELRSLGFYLRSLMDDVSSTRAHLERSEQKLQISERLATVGKLAASVAHEIRNPLSAIKMWLFSIRRTVGNAELDPKFDIISAELVRLERVVRDFLQFSRPPEIRASRQRPDVLLDQTLNLLHLKCEDENIRLQVVLRDDLPEVSVDPEQMRQVFLNLLNNAMQAMPAGGVIGLEARLAEHHGKRFVRITVTDQGEGMSDDVQARLFEPFFSTKEEGSGLGLCIAARILERHGGRLTLEGSGASGTSFAIWLPVKEGT